MRRFAVIASLVLSASATGVASAADPAAPCVQPLVHMRFGAPGRPDALHMTAAKGSTADYSKSDGLWTVIPGDGSTNTITIATLGDKLVISADQIVSPKPAMHDVFLYNRSGTTCPLDQLPKSLELAP